MAALLQFAGRTALITGAGSGIGRCLAHGLAERGCHLALADVDVHGLAETAGAVSGRSIRVTTHALDVADAQAVNAFPEHIQAAHGGLDLLFNNAGVALGGAFEDVLQRDFDWLIGINFFGVVNMTRAFLPLLKRSDDACLINLSSVFGFIAPPGQVAYVASKFAVRGFSEALRQELRGTSVAVTAVFPGGVATNIAKSARTPTGLDPAETERRKREFARALVMPPATAAAAILRAVERRKSRLVLGNDARVAVSLERLFPSSHMALLDRLRRASAGNASA